MSKVSDDEKMAMMSGLTGGQTPPPKETPTEVPTETPTEEASKETEQSTEPTKEVVTEAPSLDVSLLNQAFGKEYEDLDAYKTLFEKADGYEDIKSKYDTGLSELEEYKSLAERIDPLSHFANEDEYIRQQFLKTSDGKYSEEVIRVLSSLSPSNINGLKEVDALKIDLMVNDNMTSEEAEAYLSEKYEVDDFGSEDLELGKKAMIKKSANDAKKSLSKLYDGINVPTKKDYATARTELQQSWEQPLKDTLNSIDKIELPEGFNFVVSDEMKSGYYDATLNGLISKQVGVDSNTLESIKSGIQKQIIADNFEKILKSFTADKEEQLKSQTRSELHNDKPFDETPKATATANDNESKMRRFI